eukprot:SAG22_NODE_1600_length_4029_cov_4.088295_1_plen_127_part_00
MCGARIMSESEGYAGNVPAAAGGTGIKRELEPELADLRAYFLEERPHSSFPSNDNTDGAGLGTRTLTARIDDARQFGPDYRTYISKLQDSGGKAGELLLLRRLKRWVTVGAPAGEPKPSVPTCCRR